MRKGDVVGQVLEVRERGGGGDSLGVLRTIWTRRRGELELVADFFPMRVVTILEVFCRTWIARLVDHGDPYLENGLKTDVKIDANVARALLGKTITIGELISHSVPLNSINDLHAVFGRVLGFDLWSAIERTHDRVKVEVQRLPPTPIIRDLQAMKKSLARLIEVRHILTHELPRRRPYDVDEIDGFFDAAIEFTHATRQTLLTRLHGEYPLTMQDMGVHAGNRARVATTALESAVREIEEALEDPSAFRTSQAAWQAYCEAEVALHRGFCEGGGIEYAVEFGTRAELTEERTRRLEGWRASSPAVRTVSKE